MKKMEDTNTKYILIIQGDWNSIVGDSNKEWNNVVVKFSLGKTNSKGIRCYIFYNVCICIMKILTSNDNNVY